MVFPPMAASKAENTMPQPSGKTAGKGFHAMSKHEPSL